MVDVSKYTIDTPVLIKIMNPVGVEIPELNTKIPVESYASIAQVISIMNRGLIINFPKESENKEISKKIEDIMLDYKEKTVIAEEKGYITDKSIDVALDTIQYVNNSLVSEEEQKAETERHIFDYQDIITRIYNNLRGNELDRIFETEDYNQGVDRIKQAEKERKAYERVHNFMKSSLKERNEFDKVYVKFHQFLIPKNDAYYLDNDTIEFEVSK